MPSEQTNQVPAATSAAVPYAEAELPMKEQQKQGSLFCGCFCDMRRAVITISILSMIINLIMVVITIWGTEASFHSTINNDEYTLRYSFWDIFTAYAIGYVIIFFFYVFQIIAALQYNYRKLILAVILQLIGMGYTLWYTWIGTNSYITLMIEMGGVESYNGALFAATSVIASVVVYAFLMYPVIRLIQEIKSGVMSAETWPREARGCCKNI